MAARNPGGRPGSSPGSSPGSTAGTDFGGILARQPDAILRPTTEEELATSVRAARSRGLPVAARGYGHSTFGQAQADGGVVVDMSGLTRVREIEPGYAVVEAGASWRDVLRATLPHRLTPPVLPDYLDLSVGGTLSVGGLGGTSFRHGAVVDAVTELRVVTGAGRARGCRPDRDADLFDGVRAGLGQCGVISRARLRLVPAPARVRRYRVYYSDPLRLLRVQRALVSRGRFDYVEGQALPDPHHRGWRYMVEAAAYYTPPNRPFDSLLLDRHGIEEVDDLSYAEFVDRMTDPVRDLVAAGEWQRPHPWWTVLLPDSVADQVVTSVMDDLRPADMGDSGVIMLYPLLRDRLRAPLLRVPDEAVMFLFGLLRTASPNARSTEVMVAANRDLYTKVRALGATRYPIDAVPFGDTDWRAHFGYLWEPFCAARRRYCLPMVFAPGQNIPDV